ncbi:MAG: calcium/sodium antiporter [Phycisphaerales bacterium]|nr:calcium/sodium antiporter [Phycisphaerales bacterium]MBT7170545.1 calcium/sodium antiporter [Phycisphaerales bacterium]
MTLPILVIVFSLALLIWSANRLVDGAASTARYFGMPTLLIGMVIIGFGTSAPEMAVSALSASQGNPNLALGNAYGSNITNIALILGITAMLCPVLVQSRILRKELPILAAATGLAAWQAWDGRISRLDGIVLLIVFAGIMTWTIRSGLKHKEDVLSNDVEQELEECSMPIKAAVFWLFAGLVLLVGSSYGLVWGAVKVAEAFNVPDLIIGLTVVAIGTSLPELASSIIAVRKGEHDLAIGNVIGSNLFNTLMVVGIAGTIHPTDVSKTALLSRDIVVMSALTVLLFVLGYGVRGRGRINRIEGALLFAIYLGYTGYLISIAVRVAS